ncbi:PP2C family serine/threonine-protein phosphatase [Humibacter sp. RRB41]|uniref:PP2C family protein-serine/threonine phosphatase n=1 Tax=Humibacter sp. RRB41 TaxID=2919946 RepID=UPI001FA9D567|nr:protein phosphatase 2C domain-containing protein [Humibacter sp. RRB41]
MNLTLAVSARTDVGAVRAVNEDAVLARDPVFVVADGMGGHARGDLASSAAVRVMAERLAEGAPVTPSDVLDAVAAANEAVRALSTADASGVAVAGTTLAGVVAVSGSDGGSRYWMIINIGDSRVYSWDGARLTQLSVDHSAVQELVDAGVISADEAGEHPERNVITRALGAADDVDVDVWMLPAGGEQTFLICSDGLSKELSDDRIAAILRENPHDERLAGVLADAAITAGGRDNVSAVVVSSWPESVEAERDTVERPEHQQYLEDTRPRS